MQYVVSQIIQEDNQECGFVAGHSVVVLHYHVELPLEHDP
jgi:hypothetical protein